MRFLLAALAVLAAAPLFAHHSTAGYDMTRPVTVSGVVKRVVLTNPHSWIYLDVTDQKGRAREWSVQMMSLTQLQSYGWTLKTVKPGDVISCTGGPAKNGDPVMISNMTKLADGRTIRS